MTEMLERIIARLEQERYQWERNCIGEEHRANAQIAALKNQIASLESQLAAAKKGPKK